MKGNLYLWAILLNPAEGAPEGTLSEATKWGMVVANSPDEVEILVEPELSPDQAEREKLLGYEERTELFVGMVLRSGAGALETNGVAARVGHGRYPESRERFVR